jgi:hypothetical protein
MKKTWTKKKGPGSEPGYNMITILAKNKSNVELCVQTTYTIRKPSKKETVYVVKGTFSHPEPAWNEFFRLTKTIGRKKNG